MSDHVISHDLNAKRIIATFNRVKDLQAENERTKILGQLGEPNP